MVTKASLPVLRTLIGQSLLRDFRLQLGWLRCALSGVAEASCPIDTGTNKAIRRGEAHSYSGIIADAKSCVLLRLPLGVGR